MSQYQIVMKHVKHLCQMPQIKKGDASSLRSLTNHVSSHLNVIQPLSLIVSMQNLILYHLMLSTLDADTHKEWKLHTAHQDILLTTELISFLETRCKALELLQNAQVPRTTTAFPRPTQSAEANVRNPSHCTLATQVQCLVRNKCCKRNSIIFFCVSIETSSK